MESIKSILDSFNFSNWKGVMLEQDVRNSTSSKVQTAIKKHQIGSTEPVLFFLDNSSFGSGKDSILFTPKRLSISKSKLIGKSKTYSFNWTEISSMNIVNGRLVIKRKGFTGQTDDILLSEVLGTNKAEADRFVDLINQIRSLNTNQFTDQSKLKDHLKSKKGQEYIYAGVGLIAIVGFLFFANKEKLAEQFPSKSELPVSEYKIEGNSILLGSVENIELASNLEPIYFALPEGDSILINAEFNYPATVSLHRYKDRKELQRYTDTKTVHSSIYVPNTDIYYLNIEADEGNYMSMDVTRKLANTKSREYLYDVKIDSVIKQTPFSDSEPSTKYHFTDIFKTPHKATVNSAGKKQLTGFGENRVIIPVDLPENTKQWIYRLTLSYRDKSTETSLHDDMNSTWNKINKTAAIATAFKNPASGLIIGRPIIMQNQAYKMLAIGQAVDLATLLYDKLNEVPKEEAYLNYYIIKGETNAKNFLDGKEFDYSLESSQKNIQSIEELEKKVTSGQIYIGLENMNIKEQVYAQLEVVATQEEPVHMRLDRKLTRASISDIEQQQINQVQQAQQARINKQECDELYVELQSANGKLADIMKWQLGRTEEEKSRQIAEQEKAIQQIKSQMTNCE